MTNEIQSTIAFAEAALAQNLDPRTALFAVVDMLKRLELQGSCGICGHEVDHLENGRFVGTEPIEVVRCSNGCRGCAECVKRCVGCGAEFCEDCGDTCESCERFVCSACRRNDSRNSLVWCAECEPEYSRRENAEMAEIA